MNLRALLPASAIASLALVATAQAQDGDDNQAKFDAKIAQSWVANGSWTLDLDEALARAKEENKLVFAYFTRSYAP